MAAIGVITIVKLIRVNKIPLVLILQVCFNELRCERSLQCLVIC